MNVAGSSRSHFDDASAPPPRLAGYSLAEKLGSGSYATVYKAFSLAAGPTGVRETLAVKCVERRKVMRTRLARDNLINEIAILKKLTHRHVVKLVDFRWDASYIYLIMEYCAGGDLSRFIKQRQRLPEEIARTFLRQLASALRYCRARNISHMDLKPQNILLSWTSSRTPVLKVADFGFAQYLEEDADKASSYRGSPLYMAPEILTKRQYDARVDLWSVGVILYECLFGKAPFHCDDMQLLKRQLVSPEPVEIPRSDDVSDACLDLLTGLLQRNPADRLSFEDFFSHHFVDLASAPTEESLPLAERLCSLAADAEKAADWPTAIQSYIDALEQYILALHYTDDELDKSRLRQKIKRLMRRTEQLKKHLAVGNRPSTSMSSDEERCDADDTASSVLDEAALNSTDQLLLFWNDVPQVEAALTVATKARELELAGDFEGAIEKYEMVVESMLRVLQTESAGRRRDALRVRIELWLSTAEKLKQRTVGGHSNSLFANERGINTLTLSRLQVKEQAILDQEAEIDQFNQQNKNCRLQ